jgi:hypothetical protein
MRNLVEINTCNKDTFLAKRMLLVFVAPQHAALWQM